MTILNNRFQEDPVRNARLCIQIAEEKCVSCGDFHLRSVLRRMSVATDQRLGDMDEFRSMIKLALSRLKQTVPHIRVAIIGSTDTCILATLMASAREMGGEEIVSSLKVTLLDQCGTPLEICRVYASEAKFALDVVQTDFLSYSVADSFDLVLMHGVLPFFPSGQRLAYMSHIAAWLSEGGILISSTHLGTKPELATSEKRNQLAIANLRKLAAADPAVDATTVATLTRRLNYSLQRRETEPTVFAGLDEAEAFYRSAGLNLSSSWVVHHQQADTGIPHRKYKRRCIVMGQRGAARP